MTNKYSRIVVCCLALFSLTSCGSGNDHDDVPDSCKSYCTFACSKVGVCEDFSRSQIDDCSDSCLDTIDDDGNASSSSCQAASETLVDASCSEVERIIGLRSQQFKNLSLDDQAQAGQLLAEKICGLISIN